MASDRLTIAAARPGMLVRFPKAATGFSAGDYATIKSVTADGWVYVEGISGVSYRPALMEPVPEPALAALLAERAPGLLAQMRGVYDLYQHAPLGMLWADGIVREIERAGLIAQEPRTPLPAMYCGADAFTENQQEATRDAG